MKSMAFKTNQRGAAIVEFAIGATVFLVATFAVLEFGRLLWTHNALADATRRGARYAVNHKTIDIEAVKNVVVYGNPAGGTQSHINNLTTDKVTVTYSNFGLKQGTVQVAMTDLEFRFVVPLIGTAIQMPDYRTTLTAENAGLVPPNL